MSVLTLARPSVPPGAFRKIVVNEARLTWRQPAGIIVSIGISVLLVVIFGAIPVFRQKSAQLGGLSAFQAYVPILMCFAIGLLALAYLPGPLVSYRELGILRRLSTTPVPASWVLGAQIVVQACLIVISAITIIVVSLFFGAIVPKNPAGLVLSIVLCAAAMFAIGMLIAAVAKTSGAARGLMGASFYPLVFFSGLYYPIQLMPTVLQDIAKFTPLGAADIAIQSSVVGHFPPTEPLLVMAGYTLVFGFLARRWFRWE